MSSSFRCPFYIFLNGKFACAKLDNTKWNYLSGYEFEHYCCSSTNYVTCPNFNR